MGAKVPEFEEAIARAVGTAHAAVVSSGTAALHLALLALEIGPGDEVIVPAYTFPATANVVELCGARAVLVDVDPDTFNLDVAAVAAAVDAENARRDGGAPLRPPRRVGGAPDRGPAGGRARRGRCRRARRDATAGRRAERSASRGCLSFHPRKIVTTGEGGAVTTDEAELDAPVRRLRHHGWATLGDMPAPGFNYRLPDLLCAIGIPQLERLEELLAARERVARLVHGAARASRPARRRRRRATATAGRPTSSSSIAATRRSRALRAAGIEAQIGTWALHRLEPYRGAGRRSRARIAAFERALALPFAATTTEAEVERVAAVLTAL